MNLPLISLKNVTKSFKNGQVVALKNISLEINSGEFVSLVGSSGCGKTTLLRLMNGLIQPDSGMVLYKGGVPSGSSELSMVFQSARLLPWKTILDNIAFVLSLRGMPRAERNARAFALLGAVGLRDFAEAFPHELSGGMQQRVGLARALAIEPNVLLMDEPFAALDAMTRETLRNELLRLWHRKRMAVVFVTHDIDEAILLSQRIVMLRPRPGRVDDIVPVHLPEPRWEGDARAAPEFTALRSMLWAKVHAMAEEGRPLEELAAAFDL